MSNCVIEQALKDYNPNIVCIDFNVIKNFFITDEQRQIMAQDENLFVADKSLEKACKYLLGMNSINYQYWDIVNGDFVRYQHNGLTGALAAWDGFSRLYESLEQHHFKLNELDIDVLSTYFGAIPDAQKRVDILQESLDPVLSEQCWQIIQIHIQKHGFDVPLAQQISHLMPKSFADPYLKKIQLSLYEIAALYHARGVEVSCDITVAADYQIPKVLEALGVLHYCDSLQKTIEHQILIEEDSLEERALRSATILACQKISQEHQISIAALDRYLWLIRNSFKDKHFHLTRTTRY